MTEQIPPREPGTSTRVAYQPPMYDDHTHRFDQAGFAPPMERASSRPSKSVVAGILAGALLVGGLSGLAGAAGFTVVDHLVGGDAVPASSSTGVTRSTVSDSQAAPAPKGSVQAVASQVLPSVVKITVSGAQGAGSGSGIIISSNGEILTNNHVVDLAAGGGNIVVSFNDGSTAKASVIGTDPVTDLAVIKAQGVSGLQPATLGQSDQLQVGQEVVAIGSPFGLQATVTSGIVSALNRPVTVGETQSTATTYPAIQTDAAINPGNSGGPLVNMNGEVVGINSSIRSTSSGVGGQSGSIGLGFAIPIDNVLPIVQQLKSGQNPTHARLGVTVGDATSKNGLVTGAGVQSVQAGSAAAQAGLQPGDVITKVDNTVITGYQSLVATVRGHRPGDKVTLTYVPKGSSTSKTVTVTLNSDGGSTSS